MENLYVLGTGNASVTKCFNTCFVIQDEKGRYLMVDAGGGNGVLTILEKMEIPIPEIHHLIVTHKHTDHIFGVIWMVRTIGQLMGKGTYEGELHIYCHDELIGIIRSMCEMTLAGKVMRLLGERIFLHEVKDKEEWQILDYPITFFDIHSTKAKQFGFATVLNSGKRLTFCGDEPYQEHCFEYANETDYLFHEAFCLYEERDRYKPYEIHHSTVRDAAELAEKLQAKNLLLWHTEDDNIRRRKSMYKKEARKYYKGKIYVPYDKEVIPLV